MICAHCKEDKEPFLFTPHMVLKTKLYERFCRKCVSERAGRKFGSTDKTKYIHAVRSQYQEDSKLQQTKKTIRNLEKERLLEMRRIRLSNQK